MGDLPLLVGNVSEALMKFKASSEKTCWTAYGFRVQGFLLGFRGLGLVPDSKGLRV